MTWPNAEEIAALSRAYMTGSVIGVAVGAVMCLVGVIVVFLGGGSNGDGWLLVIVGQFLVLRSRPKITLQARELTLK